VGCVQGDAVTPAELAEAGKAAVVEGIRLWNLDIFDPQRGDHSERANDSRAVIDELLTACGWTWQVPYKGDGQVEWCGIFAGACWRAAGLDPKWLATYFASTYRLEQWASYGSFDARHPNPPPAAGEQRRLMARLSDTSSSLPFEPREGDILMIGDGNPAAGDHICLVTGWDPARRVFLTVEGNGVGLGPDGKRRQGIVTGQRKLGGSGYCARRLIRPAPSDIEPMVR
jgi:hypothetical protein